MNRRLVSVFVLLAGLVLALTWTVAAREPALAPAGALDVLTPASLPLRLNLGPADPVLDPALAAQPADLLVADQLFLGLVRADRETGAPITEMATSWSMSADATVFTFTLRSGLTWTDGNPLTAYDVRYGILRSLNPATGAELASVLFVIDNAEEYNSGTITDPDQVGVRVVDYTHLCFRLKQPAAYLPSTLTLPVARAMPAWAIAAHPADWTEPAHIVTSGAYRLASWIHGSSLELEKNPGYYDAANVQIQQVSFSMVEDATAWETYLAGNLDSVRVPTEEWMAARTDPGLAPQLHADSHLGTFYYGFNTALPPFDHPLVRKAFVAAVDRQAIIDTITGYAEQPALTFTPPGVWGHVDGFARDVGIPYDPLQAQQWLAAAGYPGGVGLPPITLMYDTRFPQNPAIASFIRQSWIDTLQATVVISQTDWASCLDLLQTNPPQVWQLRWLADHLDAQNFLRDGVDAIGRLKYGNWNNPAYEGLVDLAAYTADLEVRKALYEQAEKILVEADAVMSPLYYFADGIATRPHLQRTYGGSRLGNRIADWRLAWRLFLPLVQR